MVVFKAWEEPTESRPSVADGAEIAVTRVEEVAPPHFLHHLAEEIEALQESIDTLNTELRKRKGVVGGAYDQRPRIAHLEKTVDVLERMIRERHEAYR